LKPYGKYAWIFLGEIGLAALMQPSLVALKQTSLAALRRLRLGVYQETISGVASPRSCAMQRSCLMGRGLENRRGRLGAAIPVGV
jgi:hypothetical protein